MNRIEEENKRQQKFLENETKRKEKELKKAELSRKKELAREKRKQKITFWPFYFLLLLNIYI